MDIQTFAAKLNGRQYRDEITDEEECEAKELGFVVVFGASDDLMEFRGAINDEVGCFDGGSAAVDGDGLIKSACDNDECPYFEEKMKEAVKITAAWNEEGYSWIYNTVIPHAHFDIMKDDEMYCRGIVFSMKHLIIK